MKDEIVRQDPGNIAMLCGLLSPASFWFPEALLPSAWLQHAPFAFWLVDTLRPRVFVELGCYHGFSYLALCQAVQRLGLGARGYAVDGWQGDEHSGFYGQEVFERLSSYHDARYSDFSRLVRSTFDEACPQFEDGSIDLLHIDGRHYYDDVHHDFETWQSKLSRRAIVLFHDTNVHDRCFGIAKLWRELRNSRPTFEFVHGHGLGVLAASEVDADGLRKLFAANANPGEVRVAYARLGAAIENSYVVARETDVRKHAEQRAVDNLALSETWQREAEKRASETQELARELVKLRGELASAIQVAMDLRGEIRARDRTIGERDATLQRLEVKTRELSTVLDERNGLIRRLNDSADWPLKIILSELVRRAARLLVRPIAPRPSRRSERSSMERSAELIRKSWFFDAEWYAARYPDVAQLGVDPVLHYLTSGATEGRDPSSYFDTDWYLAQNPDVARAGVNPLLHYLCDGAREGRAPMPLSQETSGRIGDPSVRIEQAGEIERLARDNQALSNIVDTLVHRADELLDSRPWRIGRTAARIERPFRKFLLGDRRRFRHLTRAYFREAAKQAAGFRASWHHASGAPDDVPAASVEVSVGATLTNLWSAIGRQHGDKRT